MSTLSKVKIMQACIAKWEQWKDGGNDPSTRDEAIRIISVELKAAGCHVTFASLKNQAKSVIKADGSEEIDDNLSFIVWDLTQNNGTALNYSRDYNFLSGLLHQASHALRTMTRAIVTIGKQRVSIPTRMSIKGMGTAQRLGKLTRSQLGDLINQFVEEAQAKVARWKFMGANKEDIHKFLRKLNRECLALYEVPALPKKVGTAKGVGVPMSKAAANSGATTAVV